MDILNHVSLGLESFNFRSQCFNCQTIKVDCLLISPHSTTLKSHVKVMRITDMITNIKELLIVSTIGNVKRTVILKLG